MPLCLLLIQCLILALFLTHDFWFLIVYPVIVLDPDPVPVYVSDHVLDPVPDPVIAPDHILFLFPVIVFRD